MIARKRLTGHNADLILVLFISAASALSVTPHAAAQSLADVEVDIDDIPPQVLPGPRRGERNPQDILAPDHVQAPEPFAQWDRMLGDMFGIRTGMEDAGFSPNAALVYDWSAAWDGGASSKPTSRALTDVSLAIDFDVLFGLAGGTAFIDMQWQNGVDASTKVGDLQAFSNIDAPNFIQINELWYEQWLFGQLFRLKVGKVDTNSEFAFVDHGAEFINSSMGFTPTIFLLPTYPDPAFSVNLFVYPADWLYAGVGVYDGSTADGISTGPRGVRTFFSQDADALFVIGEIGATWALFGGTLPGRLGFGGWGTDALLDRLDSGNESGTQGFFIVLDQMLWRESGGDEDDMQGLGMFLQLGWADEDVSEIASHVGGGITSSGLIPGRGSDVIGLGATWVDLSDVPAAGFTESSELALEFFYKLQLTNFVSIKPDLQYIINPGGDSSLDNALVGTLRVEVTF